MLDRDRQGSRATEPVPAIDGGVTRPPQDLLDQVRDLGIEVGSIVGRGASSVVWAATEADGTPVVLKLPVQRHEVDHQALAHEAAVLDHLAATLPTGPGPAPVIRLRRVVRARPRDHTTTAVAGRGGADLQPFPPAATIEALVLGPRGDTTLDLWWTRTRETLGARAQEGPVLGEAPVALLLVVVDHLIEALTAIHRAGVVHGDLSPRNIVLWGDRPLLIDFAASTLTGGTASQVQGTLPYAAPEVVAGAPSDAASDVFALGRIVIELVLGRAVATAANSYDDLVAAGCPPPLAEVVVRSQRTDPADRPPVGAWAATLAAARTGDARDPRARTAPTAPRTSRGPVPRLGPLDTLDPHDPHDPLHPHETHETPAIPGAQPLALPPPAAVTVPFGPRPPRPDPPPSRRFAGARRSAGAAALIAVVALATLVIALAVALGRDGAGGSPGVGGVAAETASAPPAAGRPADALPPPPPTPDRPDEGDRPDRSDGSDVQWDPDRAEATVTTGTTVTRYRIGQPGDQLVVGRWHCRGGARPALYRPTSGDLYEFTGWADPGQPLPSATVTATRTIGGHARVVVGDDGCDRPLVDPVPPAGARLPSPAPAAATGDGP